MTPKSHNQERTSRILYTVLVLVLVVLTVVFVVSSIASRRTDAPAETTDGTSLESATLSTEEKPTTTAPETSATEPTGNENKLPTFALPIDSSLLSPFNNTVPVYSLTMNDYRTHSGVDVSAPLGTAVEAAADGIIKEIYADPMMGNCVTIAHAGDCVTVYKNLSGEVPAGLEPGSAVSKGDVIGSVGESAIIEIAEEPHLHFEIQISGVSVNPEDYLTFPENGNYED